MNNFFSRLRYSFGNEDWWTESQALRLHANARVFCITASGDRPLHLLMDPCSSIVTIDANPIQNYLLHLKRTAMEVLNFAEYLAFLGGSPSPSRRALFEEHLEPHMDRNAALYWQENDKTIERGVIFQGAFERRVKLTKLFFFFARKEIQNLFACQSLEEQRLYLKKHWNHTKWKTIFQWLVPPFVRLAVRDPSINEYKKRGINPGLEIYERMMRCLDHSLASESLLISFIFKQTVDERGYPPYLTREGFHKIKPQLNRLTVITQDAISYLEEVPEGSFDRFSLSDISSYLSPQYFEKLMRAMYRAARPEARFCMRQLMTRYSVPADLAPHFVREVELEESLEAQDRAFVYHYTVGTILKT